MNADSRHALKGTSPTPKEDLCYITGYRHDGARGVSEIQQTNVSILPSTEAGLIGVSGIFSPLSGRHFIGSASHGSGFGFGVRSGISLRSLHHEVRPILAGVRRAGSLGRWHGVCHPKYGGRDPDE